MSLHVLLLKSLDSFSDALVFRIPTACGIELKMLLCALVLFSCLSSIASIVSLSIFETALCLRSFHVRIAKFRYLSQHLRVYKK